MGKWPVPPFLDPAVFSLVQRVGRLEKEALWHVFGMYVRGIFLVVPYTVTVYGVHAEFNMEDYGDLCSVHMYAW